MYSRHILPGIAVEVPSPAFPDALPRMDVALFVGFAAKGPVHRPIQIDSVATYAQVFGGDLVLARDLERGSDAMAALAPAVRGFFSNGGTRCWVIRVARTEALERRWRPKDHVGRDVAAARTFGLPGIDVAGGGAAQVSAASVGSWADDMRVSARLERSIGRIRLMLRADVGGLSVTSGPFGLAPGDPDSWWRVLDDDGFYADDRAVAQARPLLAPVGTPATWAATRLDDFWSVGVSADPEPRTPLERDGLSRFDAELFLDPELASLRITTIASEAARVCDLDGRSLFGLHGAFSVPGGADFGEPSLIAVPDAVQPGWDARRSEALPPPVNVPAEQPAAWRDHSGSCAVAPPDPEISRPDTTRFLDCATRVLATPAFVHIDSVRPTGVLDLIWSISEANAIYVLEESSRADFKGAREIWRGPDLAQRVAIAREGAYYYRIHAEHDGNISASSVTGVLAQNSAWATRSATTYDSKTLLDVQTALLRTCAAMGDQFVPLSLPRHYGPTQATSHAAALNAAFAQNETRALSFGALYHPWLVSPLGSTKTPVLIDTPPEGAVLGTFARRARTHGAWAAPANIVIQDIVALAPTVLDADRETLACAGINLIRRGASGFVVSDALTLSPEPDWDEVNVRRLMSLVRRVCVRRGSAFVFEPNGDVVRRAVERTFGHMLDDMVGRGAFAGKGGADSYRLTVDPTDSDRMNGRLIVEIAIAPAQPLRFLTLVLAQAGERFTIAEER